jgi:tetratricopeptide (TPR) repeat protein
MAGAKLIGSKVFVRFCIQQLMESPSVLQETMVSELAALRHSSTIDQIWELATTALIDKITYVDSTYREMQSLMRDVVSFLISSWHGPNVDDEILKQWRRSGLRESDVVAALRQLCNSSANKNKESEAIYYLARFYEAKCRDRQALEFYVKAARESNNLKYIITAGEMALKLGEILIAESIFQPAVSKISSQEVSLRVAAINGLASTHFHRGAYQSALLYYEEIMGELETLGDDLLHAAVMNNVGWANVEIGRYRDGIQLLLRAKDMKEAVGDTGASVALTACNLSATYGRLKEPQEALKRLREAEMIVQREYKARFPRHPIFVKIYNCQGAILFDLKEFQAASQAFKHALDIASDVFPKCHIEKILINFNLAMTFKYLNDLVRFKQQRNNVLSLLHQCENAPPTILQEISRAMFSDRCPDKDLTD